MTFKMGYIRGSLYKLNLANSVSIEKKFHCNETRRNLSICSGCIIFSRVLTIICYVCRDFSLMYNVISCMCRPVLIIYCEVEARVR